MFSQFSKVANKINNAQITASYRALNKAVSKTQTQYKRLIASDTGLKASAITPRFASKKASKKSLAAYVSFGVKYGVSLSEFKPKEKQVRIGKRKHKGVSVKLPEVGRVVVPKAWLWVTSGKSLVLARKGQARRPTYSPKYSLSDIAKRHQADMKKLMRSEFDNVFSEQLKYEANRI